MLLSRFVPPAARRQLEFTIIETRKSKISPFNKKHVLLFLASADIAVILAAKGFINTIVLYQPYLLFRVLLYE